MGRAEKSLANQAEPLMTSSKLERRRQEKRQNKFDRVSLGERIASVKKLRSENKALTGDLEGFRLAMGRSQLGARREEEGSRSILSKVGLSRSATRRSAPK